MALGSDGCFGSAELGRSQNSVPSYLVAPRSFSCGSGVYNITYMYSSPSRTGLCKRVVEGLRVGLELVEYSGGGYNSTGMC